MKKYIITLCCLFSLSFYGQEKRTNESKIAELYGDYLSYFMSHDPKRIESLDNFLTNRVEYREVPQENEKDDLLKLSEIPLFNKYNPNMVRDEKFDPDNFNILKYHINFYDIRTQVIRVDNTDTVIILKPQKNN